MKQSVNQTFSCRLRQARKMKGISLDLLAGQINPPISKQAISKYEQGKMLPDSKVLLSIAHILGLKVDFFFRPYTVVVDNVDFRKKAKCSKKKTDSIRERVHEELERYLEIEQLSSSDQTFDIKRRKIESLEGARHFASAIRTKFQLGMDGISNVIEVLEDFGIKVIEVDEDNDFDGLSGFANRHIPVIVVNAKFSSEHKRFTALHELGHLVMDIPDHIEHREAESLCHAFANELLLPFSVIKSKIGEKRQDISLAELIDIQKQFGISIDAIMYVLRQHEVITESRYKTFNIKKNTNRTFKENVQRSRIQEERSGRFSRMVYRALADELISVSKAANLLNTSVDKVKVQLQLV